MDDAFHEAHMRHSNLLWVSGEDQRAVFRSGQKEW